MSRCALAALFAVVSLFISAATGQAGNLPPIQTVFLILMENADWSSVRYNPDMPFLNNTLLPQASYCSQYYNVPNNHPSEPNYLWLEAGTNFGIFNSLDPYANHQSTTNHLVTYLKNAGIPWKAYEEDISGTYVPLGDTNKFAVRHCAFLYFDDVTGTNNPNYPYGIAHIRPYSELAGDLAGNTVARYNFITPNLCDDMHDSCAPTSNTAIQGDTWLASEIPKITNSAAFKNNGAIFITWDEGANNDAIGMIVLSPLAKGGGYQGTNYYTHSSTLRTFQEIFNVMPFLGDAANANDLSDLFTPPPTNLPPAGFCIASLTKPPGGAASLNVTGATPGKTNLVQCSTDLKAWTTIATNLAASTNYSWGDPSATNANRRYYRLIQLP